MKKELKVKIEDIDLLERHLKEIGAVFDHELQAIDTYFKQEAGSVLKIVEDNRGDFLSELESTEGGFTIKQRTEITDVESARAKLSSQFGIQRILKKRRRIYTYREYIIDLNLIEGVGDFLVLVGEKPEESIIENELGVVNPEYVRVPFSEL